MIQDILPKIYHNEYIPGKPEAEDTVFFFRKGEILSAENAEGAICFPTLGQAQAEGLLSVKCLEENDCAAEGAREKRSGEDPETGTKTLQYLFRIDEHAYYLYAGENAEPFGEYGYKPLRLIRKARPKDSCFAAMTAWHLSVWYKNNRFCGRCGSPVTHDDKERMLRCPDCGNQIYPRINPAVIVGVTDKNRIMMTRYAGREYKGNALIAGFCEIGETVEETVRREVMEEVGLHVKNIRYYKSQPWGFSGDMLMGFFCEVDGTRQVHLDETELSRAVWVKRSDIGEEPANLSLTADMIMHFKHQPEGEASLPDQIRSIWHDHIPGVPERKGTSAVLIPLIEKEGEYHLLYEQRASGLKHQPGEICFPGGRVENGETPKEAALRETAEELLVDTDQIELLAAMDAEMGPSGAPIWPFVGLLRDYHETFSREEVGRVFTIPLSWYAAHQPETHMTELVTTPGEDFPYQLIPGGKQYPFRRKKHEMVFYQTPEAVIWGVTAKITEHFLREIRLPADCKDQAEE